MYTYKQHVNVFMYEHVYMFTTTVKEEFVNFTGNDEPGGFPAGRWVRKIQIKNSNMKFSQKFNYSLL